SFFLSRLMKYTVDTKDLPLDEIYVVWLMKDIIVGILNGLLAYLILSAVQIAGGFIDFQMGFAIANVVVPQTGAQSPLIGQFFYIIALLFLLSVVGYHLLIDGIVHSYQFIPLDAL